MKTNAVRKSGVKKARRPEGVVTLRADVPREVRDALRDKFHGRVKGLSLPVCLRWLAGQSEHFVSILMFGAMNDPNGVPGGALMECGGKPELRFGERFYHLMPVEPLPDSESDVSKLLSDRGRAAIQEFRAGVKKTHYGERDVVILTVSTYTGNGAPEEAPDGVFQVVAFSAQPWALEYAIQQVNRLAFSLDRHAAPSGDLHNSMAVVERAERLARALECGPESERTIPAAVGMLPAPADQKAGAAQAAREADIEAIGDTLRGVGPEYAKALRESLLGRLKKLGVL